MLLILSVVLALVAIPVTRALVKRHREIQERIAEHNEWVRQRDQERAAWRDKIADARCLLSGGNSWRDPVGKAAFVRQVFGEGVPSYLWYEVTEDLSPEDVKAICLMFWGGQPQFGDFEMHRSLRIRNAKHFLSEIVLDDGRRFPLRQVGHADIFFEEGDPDVIVFSHFFEEMAVEV